MNFIQLRRAVLLGIVLLSIGGAVDASQLFLKPAIGNGLEVSGDGSVAIGGPAYRWSPPVTPVLLNVPDAAQVTAASYDGSVIVGAVRRPIGFEGFRWSESGGYRALGRPGNNYMTIPQDVSNNGEIIVGSIYNLDLNIGQAYRWTSSTGMVPLSYLPGAFPITSGEEAFATAISGDGSVIVGSSPDGDRRVAVRWINGQVSFLGTLTGNGDDTAVDISVDGSVIVGIAGGPFNAQAFRWTEPEGMVSLFPLRSAHDVTADGSLVLGFGELNNKSQLLMWDELNGPRSVVDMLASEFPLLNGWDITSGAFSDDGRVIVGAAISPSREFFEFMAIVPEPSTLAMLLAALPLAYLAYRRRRS